jgi:hypothetical protein
MGTFLTIALVIVITIIVIVIGSAIALVIGISSAVRKAAANGTIKVRSTSRVLHNANRINERILGLVYFEDTHRAYMPTQYRVYEFELRSDDPNKGISHVYISDKEIHDFYPNTGKTVPDVIARWPLRPMVAFLLFYNQSKRVVLYDAKRRDIPYEWTYEQFLGTSDFNVMFAYTHIMGNNNTPTIRMVNNKGQYIEYDALMRKPSSRGLFLLKSIMNMPDPRVSFVYRGNYFDVNDPLRLIAVSNKYIRAMKGYTHDILATNYDDTLVKHLAKI